MSIPPGNDPDCNVIPVLSLLHVNVIVPILDPPENEPNDPADVTHVGASETVNTAFV